MQPDRKIFLVIRELAGARLESETLTWDLAVHRRQINQHEMLD